MSGLKKIEGPMLRQHSSLSAGDECYFLFEYISKEDSFENLLIRDLKKPVDRRDKPEWPYKSLAINDIARELGAGLPEIVDFDTTTFIPVPPSKTRASALYDDRLLQILVRASPAHADIRELIVCKEDQAPAHTSDERPSVRALLQNYEWNSRLTAGVRPQVVLFDDLITGGNHFVACKQFILARYPSTKVTGVFVARRVREEM